MSKHVMLPAAGIFLCTAASATSLTPGMYASTATVVSNNGNSNCSQVGLVPGAPYNAALKYPGDGKKGLIFYTPQTGGESLCDKFAAIPPGGVNGFNTKSTCGIFDINGSEGTESGIKFAFAASVADANSAVVAYTITIPNGDPVGAGCMATIDATWIRSGK